MFEKKFSFTGNYGKPKIQTFAEFLGKQEGELITLADISFNLNVLTLIETELTKRFYGDVKINLFFYNSFSFSLTPIIFRQDDIEIYNLIMELMSLENTNTVLLPVFRIDEWIGCVENQIFTINSFIEFIERVKHCTEYVYHFFNLSNIDEFGITIRYCKQVKTPE